MRLSLTLFAKNPNQLDQASIFFALNLRFNQTQVLQHKFHLHSIEERVTIWVHKAQADKSRVLGLCYHRRSNVYLLGESTAVLVLEDNINKCHVHFSLGKTWKCRD